MKSPHVEWTEEKLKVRVAKLVRRQSLFDKHNASNKQHSATQRMITKVTEKLLELRKKMGKGSKK